MGIESDTLLAVSRGLYKRSKTKITYFHIHISVQKDVPELQVTMDNLMCMHVMTCTDQLHQQETRLGLGISFAPSKKVVETLMVSLAQRSERIDAWNIPRSRIAP